MKPKPELDYVVSRDRAPDYLKELGLKPDREGNRIAQELWMEGIQAYLSTIGRKGGKVGGKSTSRAKVRASRENGKLGGRPRKDAAKSTRK